MQLRERLTSYVAVPELLFACVWYMDFLLPQFYTGLLPVYFFVKAKGLQPGVGRMLKLREPPA